MASKLKEKLQRIFAGKKSKGDKDNSPTTGKSEKQNENANGQVGTKSELPERSRLQIAREFFAHDRFASSAGVAIDDVSDEQVQCSVTLNAVHLNALGSVQGGAIFTLADLAFAVHSNLAMITDGKSGANVGQSCNIAYLKPPRGEKLTAKSVCLSRGKTMSVYEVTITDGRGTAVAVMIGNAFATDFRPENLA